MTASRDTSYIADKLRGRLAGVKEHAGYFKALCPAHKNTDPKSPALSVKLYEDRVGVKCHGNPPCSTAAILDPLGMRPAELFVDHDSRRGRLRPVPRAASNGAGHTRETREAAGYIYPDADGRPYMRVQRTADKRFFQQRYDADVGEYRHGLDGLAPILYHADKLAHGYDKSKPLFIVEGEKDADRLIAEGLQATTAPMGAGKWRPEYADQVRGYEDIRVLADNDPPGRAHAEAVVAAVPRARVIELDGLPPKGDVSDWLDAGATPEQLLELTRSGDEGDAKEEGRVLLGRAIVEGIEPPRELVDDVLLEGRAHSIYSGPGLGKTFLMLWLALAVIERGLPVMLYDAENGPRLMAERLMQQGADPALLDELLFYYPFPSLATTEAGRLAYETALERARPALVCFDSWIGFLAANGLDENSSNDIATFAANYIAPARSRGISTLMLDHVPHEGKHARGSTRKKDELDVVWSLRSQKPFDRETTGHVMLVREKDREGWLPQSVGFSVGGDGEGNLVFARSAGALVAAGDDGLKDSERASLRALESLEKSGATASEWEQAADGFGVKRRTFYNARRVLLRKGRILQDKHGRYSPSVNGCKSSAMHPFAPDPERSANGAAAYKAAPFAPTGAAEGDTPLSDLLEPGESAPLAELRERRERHEDDDWSEV